MRHRHVWFYRILLCLCALAGLAVPARGGAIEILAPGTFRDQGGRIIRVKKPFTRIICLYGAHAENLYALGAWDQVSGISAHTDLPGHPGAVEGKPVYSYHDGLEKFLAGRPDLILVRPMIERAHARLVQRLRRSGISVVSLQPGHVEEMFTYWRVLGLLTGRSARSEDMVVRFQKAVEDFKTLARTVGRKKTVYFEAIHAKMKTFSPDAMAMFVLETAGGINAAAGARPVRGTNIAAFGKERLLSLGAGIDVYLAQKGAMNRTSLALIRAEPGFMLIKAVREGRIHLIDEAIVARPTPCLLQGIYAIGTLLYPETFSGPGRQILARSGQ